MKNKLTILISGFIILTLLQLVSCEKCGPFPNKFKVIGLYGENYKVTYDVMADPKLVLSKIVNENEIVYYNEYAILIVPQQERYFAQNSKSWNFSFMPSAYACSPKIPTTDEKIDSIVILSDKDFNINYPSGSDLSDLFDVVIEDYANGISHNKYGLKEYLSTNPIVPSTMTLILKEKPDLKTDFEFLVKYYQKGIENNDYFEFKTKKVLFNY